MVKPGDKIYRVNEWTKYDGMKMIPTLEMHVALVTKITAKSIYITNADTPSHNTPLAFGCRCSVPLDSHINLTPKEAYREYLGIAGKKIVRLMKAVDEAKAYAAIAGKLEQEAR